jgi:hypothetical protein
MLENIDPEPEELPYNFANYTFRVLHDLISKYKWLEKRGTPNQSMYAKAELRWIKRSINKLMGAYTLELDDATIDIYPNMIRVAWTGYEWADPSDESLPHPENVLVIRPNSAQLSTKADFNAWNTKPIELKLKQ